MNYGILSLLPPIVAVFATLFITLAPQGFPFKKVGGNDFRVALTMGYLYGAVVLMALIALFKVMHFKETFKIYVDGMKSMTDVAVTLVLAVIFVWNKMDVKLEKNAV